MAIPTVDPGTEVKSIDHNSIVGLLNGTADDAANAYAQPVKLYQFNNASTYSLIVGNQDPTAGLIAQFQYGPVGAATVVAQITKAGITGTIRDTSIQFPLDAYAGGATINNAAPADTASATADAAWKAAFDAVAAAGGGTVTLGPGTYPGPSAAVTNWTDNTIIRGVGVDATKILHPKNSATPPIFFFNRTNCGITELTVDGNRVNNNDVDAGFDSSEVSLDGTRCWAYRIKVSDFNKTGITCIGNANSVIDCEVGLATPVTSYTALNAGTAHDGATTFAKDYGGLYGIGTLGAVACQDILISGCLIYGLRSAAIVAGGARLIVERNRTFNCHRKDLPLGVGGGHIALCLTGGAGTTRATYVTISDNLIGPTNVNGIASGFEINSADHVALVNNHVDGTASGGFGLATGITMAASPSAPTNVSIVGGSIKGCVTGLNVGDGNVLWGIENVSFASNTTVAIKVAGASDQFQVIACRFKGNTANWDQSGLTGVNWSSAYHAIADGGDVPSQLYKAIAAVYGQTIQNGSATGNGLDVAGGSTGGQYALKVSDYTNVYPFLLVNGAGAVSFGGTALNAQLLNVQMLTELKSLSTGGTTTDTTMLMPAGAVILGVSVRVTTAITSGGGVTSFSVGDSGSATRFSTTGTVALALGTTDAGTKAGAYYNASALAVRVTANGGTPTGGAVRLTMHYYTVTPPSS